MTPKIGEIITITKRKGSTWHSGAGGGDPRNVELPFTGKVTNIKYDALCVGGYGFSLTHITWEYTPQEPIIFIWTYQYLNQETQLSA